MTGSCRFPIWKKRKINKRRYRKRKRIAGLSLVLPLFIPPPMGHLLSLGLPLLRLDLPPLCLDHLFPLHLLYLYLLYLLLPVLLCLLCLRLLNPFRLFYLLHLLYLLYLPCLLHLLRLFCQLCLLYLPHLLCLLYLLPLHLLCSNRPRIYQL